MERAKLIVKNFGPLKDIEIEVREMVTFIGAQASGKSTLAKLLSIFEDEIFRRYDKISFEDELRKYNLFSFLREDSYIFYKSGLFEFILKGSLKTKQSEIKKVIQDLLEIKKTNEKLIGIDNYLGELENQDVTSIDFFFRKEFVKNLNNILEVIIEKQKLNPLYDYLENQELFISINSIYLFPDSLYIPSERNFLHLIAENTLGLINNNIQIPKHILNIGQEYEKALGKIKELPLNLIDKSLKYIRDGKTSYIYHSENEKINLLESASGLQSIIPILLLVEYSKFTRNKYKYNFVIEEPELNLYPQAQHELVKYLVKNCISDRKKLILTTHSPFILASINNLLLAFDKGKNNPKAVSKIIKKESWLNPNNFIAYELKNGKAKKIMNDKLGQIDENMIDKVSDAFSNEFDKLLDL
jgi:predicted ATPase